MDEAALLTALFSWTGAGLSGTWEEKPSPLSGGYLPVYPAETFIWCRCGAVLPVFIDWAGLCLGNGEA